MKKWLPLAVLLLGLACHPRLVAIADSQYTSTGEVVFVEPAASEPEQPSAAPSAQASSHQQHQPPATSQAPPSRSGLVPRLGERPEILYGLIGSLLIVTMLLFFIIKQHKEDKEEGK
ncbi:hypothetical protein KTT66_07670 [Lacticaseibacillus casei]|jgi:hypothetical protein|uniref:Gram-positive cocci surface proteins LPxTG domain-containing protein n=1 Tax=Lacticaseibacillus huelsenbergensis TaxID=3035291 RepID=A0ABY8DW75_9LACO|nr:MULTISPECIES: hypothetical protein [Lacticaseibacillus]MDG3062176.1 hypothetical protein [Lacticaseibacillus sp. BCRC 81376]QVI36286.1 hypothetical protein KGS74_08435 [Lacticaseibacillus casei]QXG58085.1 hypothetical protein KTT66_07670 [Lacticaseibacillus casei]WFB40443.1 hypothetical protein LHUE1_001235 [Lacticaseibacillus huelsenbergensis]WFB42195.1 hypothetical protein LHUE2_000158 [Lacticaseibacillus huelsenbergensis]